MLKSTHRFQLQHLCRKTVDPRFFLMLRKFSMCSIFFLLFLKLSQYYSADFWVSDRRKKGRSDVPDKKLWQNGRKRFAHVENFLNKMQTSDSQCPEMKKKKTIFCQKSPKISSGHPKSSWELIGAKVFAKKHKLFLWKAEKTAKLLIVFHFLLFSKLILWTLRMYLSQLYPRLLDVGLVIHAWFFFQQKTKRCRSRSEKFKKVLNTFRKNFFVENVQSKCNFGNPPIVSC